MKALDRNETAFGRKPSVDHGEVRLEVGAACEKADCVGRFGDDLVAQVADQAGEDRARRRRIVGNDDAQGLRRLGQAARRPRPPEFLRAA